MWNASQHHLTKTFSVPQGERGNGEKMKYFTWKILVYTFCASALSPYANRWSKVVEAFSSNFLFLRFACHCHTRTLSLAICKFCCIRATFRKNCALGKLSFSALLGTFDYLITWKRERKRERNRGYRLIAITLKVVFFSCTILFAKKQSSKWIYFQWHCCCCWCCWWWWRNQCY